jgi:hypothetical protein
MVYLQMLTRAEVLKQFNKYKVVRYDVKTQSMVSVPVIPEVAFYEVIPGIQELELLP